MPENAGRRGGAAGTVQISPVAAEFIRGKGPEYANALDLVVAAATEFKANRRYAGKSTADLERMAADAAKKLAALSALGVKVPQIAA